MKLEFGDLVAKAAAIEAAEAEITRVRTFEHRVIRALRKMITTSREQLVKLYGEDAVHEAERLTEQLAKEEARTP
jgi:hypothetical protein